MILCLIQIPLAIVLAVVVGGGVIANQESEPLILLSKVLTKDRGGDWEVSDKYRYDTVGNLLKRIHYYELSEEYRYEYGYDEKGQQISETYHYIYPWKNDDYFRFYTYEYDDSGNMMKRAEVLDDGSVRMWWEYSYDAAGNMIGEIQYKNQDGVACQEAWKEYEYDDDGNLIQYVNYWPQRDSVFERQESEYDTNGNLVKYMSYGRDGSIQEWHEYKYDGSGNMLKETWYDPRGKAVWWIQYTYGEYGVLTEKAYNDRKVEFEYDSSGNLQKRTVYHPQGECYAGGWDEYIYDSNGNLIKVECWEGNSSGDRSCANIWRKYKYKYITIYLTKSKEK